MVVFLKIQGLYDQHVEKAHSFDGLFYFFSK